MVSKGQIDWNCIARLHNHVLAHLNSPTASRCHIKASHMNSLTASRRHIKAYHVVVISLKVLIAQKKLSDSHLR